MCGIAGQVITQDEGVVDRQALEVVARAMQARGPDGKGFWVTENEQIGFAHTRLSIIDLSEQAAQPMRDVQSRYTITFNGEIYNYKTLREHCVEKGYDFKTHSDTEVLLALYQYYSEQMLTRLRGMFAFAIYDQIHEKLFIARDPLGIKPLYYSFSNSGFYFCSSLNAMRDAEWINTQKINKTAIESFLNLGSVQEPDTYYSQANMLPAGSYGFLYSGDKTLAIKQYWRIQDAVTTTSPNRINTQELLENAVSDSVQSHMVSDIPIGVFLSAGIDSSVVATMMRKYTHAPITAITLGFEEFQDDDDEVVLASQFAQEYGFKHEVSLLSKEQFLAELPEFFAAMEQPTIDALNVWFVAKAAKQAGLKVVLSGIGGDEIFGGYPSFYRIPKLLRWSSLLKWLPYSILKKLFAATNQKKLRYLKQYSDDIRSLYLLQRSIYMKQELRGKLLNLNKVESNQKIEANEKEYDFLSSQSSLPRVGSNLEQISHLETVVYLRNQLLRDADWAGMAHSVEIRTPLVDHQLYDQLALLNTKERFAAGKAALLNLLDDQCKQRLQNRAKTGFILPMKQWIDGAENEAHWSRSYADTVFQHFVDKKVIDRRY